jgi:hypothetical protein
MLLLRPSCKTSMLQEKPPPSSPLEGTSSSPEERSDHLSIYFLPLFYGPFLLIFGKLTQVQPVLVFLNF